MEPVSEEDINLAPAKPIGDRILPVSEDDAEDHHHFMKEFHPETFDPDLPFEDYGYMRTTHRWGQRGERHNRYIDAIAVDVKRETKYGNSLSTLQDLKEEHTAAVNLRQMRHVYELQLTSPARMDLSGSREFGQRLRQQEDEIFGRSSDEDEGDSPVRSKPWKEHDYSAQPRDTQTGRFTRRSEEGIEAESD